MPRKIIYSYGDIVGDNNIVFIKELLVPKGSLRKALFKCPICGQEFVAGINNIRYNHTKSCGCLRHQKSPTRLNLEGQIFGYLEVLKDTGKVNNNNSAVWECYCHGCGRVVERSAADLVHHEHKQSCGCKKSILISEKLRTDLKGKKIGKLTVLSYNENVSKEKGKACWNCICDCGSKIVVSAVDLLKKNHTVSCGCIKSRGEERIVKILIDLQISFVRQKWFNDCRNPKTNNVLYFDFYLPDYNICIEYDGEQHFKPNNRGWNNEKHFTKIKKLDKIKNVYCQERNIPLIRIPYTDYEELNQNYLQNRIKLITH